MRLWYLFAACSSLLAQVSAGGPVTKSPGDKVTLKISATSQPARVPVALNWEVVFPAQLMDLESKATETGSAASDSGKSLQCAPRKEYVWSCTLSGGQRPIGDGEIAIFHFIIRSTAQAGKAVLTIDGAEAIMADGKHAPLNKTESVVIIR